MKHYYYVLPDYRILATDDEVPAELIRESADDGDPIDSFKEGEVRCELDSEYASPIHTDTGQLKGETELEFYRRDPINFTFEYGIATFTGFKIVEAPHEYIISQSKIIIPSWEEVQ